MPILEEIQDKDIDDLDFDPADFDPKNLFSRSMPVDGVPDMDAVLRGLGASTEAADNGQRGQRTRDKGQETTDNGQRTADNGQQTADNKDTAYIQDAKDIEKFKTWQVLYPVYFDKNKSHAQGRRVQSELAVCNPLADTIAAACRDMGVYCLHEADKCHPKDWANPGRVRVLYRGSSELGLGRVETVRNKRHLLRLVARFLQLHPTTLETPMQSRVFARILAQSKEAVPPNFRPEPRGVPRGWALSGILPAHSRAVGSGQEVSSEALDQMQSAMFPGLQQAPARPAKGRKVKVRVSR